jgi:hypothetical protein
MLINQLGVLGNLQKLYCSGMNLKEKYQEASRILAIGQYKKLKTLILSNANISELPAGFGGLVNLEVLNLDGNLLFLIPEDLQYLVNLTTLSMKNNQITSIPEFVYALPQLQSLFVSGNKLKTEGGRMSKKLKENPAFETDLVAKETAGSGKVTLANEVVKELERLGISKSKSAPKKNKTVLIRSEEDEDEGEDGSEYEVPAPLTTFLFGYEWRKSLVLKEEYLDDDMDDEERKVEISVDCKSESIVSEGVAYLCIGQGTDAGAPTIYLINLQDPNTDNPMVFSWDYETELSERDKLSEFLAWFEKGE